MSSYWANRMERAQNAIALKSEKEINKQLRKYYATAQRRVIDDCEITFNRVMASIAADKTPTPADLYKLDRYWQMQGQLKAEMQKLGDKEIALLNRKFEQEWHDIYNSVAWPSQAEYATISTDGAKAMINNAWVSDGKNYSERIWKNTERLVETLNDNLIHCVITGKKTTQLRDLLQERFGVSLRQANMLVRTETAHIKTQAAAQRYKDAGLTRYEFLGRKEHDGCGHSPDCHALNGKIFLFSEMQPGENAPPMHPNCRCAIAPILD